MIRHSPARARLAALLGFALSACASVVPIDRHAPPDPTWPELRVIEHHVHGGEVLRQCYRFVSLPMKLVGALPQACAMVYFDRGECHIYVRGDYPDAAVLKHERLHCRGFDHIGASTLRDAWLDYHQRILGDPARTALAK